MEETKTEKDIEENIWRMEIFFCEGEDKRRKKRRQICEERKHFFANGEENGEGKGGKYLEKENIVCGGEENQRRKTR